MISPFGQMLRFWGEWDKLLMSFRSRRESDRRTDVGPHQTRPDASPDLNALRAGIGTALRMVHSGGLREEVPDRIAELLKQLDRAETDPA
jgi:Anti-sigma factor NepR